MNKIILCCGLFLLLLSGCGGTQEETYEKISDEDMDTLLAGETLENPENVEIDQGALELKDLVALYVYDCDVDGEEVVGYSLVPLPFESVEDGQTIKRSLNRIEVHHISGYNYIPLYEFGVGGDILPCYRGEVDGEKEQWIKFAIINEAALLAPVVSEEKSKELDATGETWVNVAEYTDAE